MEFREFIDMSALGLPTVTKRGKVIGVTHTANAAVVQLEGGTMLRFNADELRMIHGGKPEIGKTMKVIFQRHPMNGSKEPSQIQWVEVM